MAKYHFEQTIKDFCNSYVLSKKEREFLKKFKASVLENKNDKKKLILAMISYRNLENPKLEEKQEALSKIITTYVLSHYIDGFLCCKGGFINADEIREQYQSSISFFFSYPKAFSKRIYSLQESTSQNSLFTKTLDELINFSTCDVKDLNAIIKLKLCK